MSSGLSELLSATEGGRRPGDADALAWLVEAPAARAVVNNGRDIRTLRAIPEQDQSADSGRRVDAGLIRLAHTARDPNDRVVAIRGRRCGWNVVEVGSMNLFKLPAAAHRSLPEHNS